MENGRKPAVSGASVEGTRSSTTDILFTKMDKIIYKLGPLISSPQWWQNYVDDVKNRVVPMTVVDTITKELSEIGIEFIHHKGEDVVHDELRVQNDTILTMLILKWS